MRNNGEQDVSKVTDMRWMFAGTAAFGSDISAWVRHFKFGPQCVPLLQHVFHLMVSLLRRVFPYKITRALANSVWKMMKLCATTGSRMSPRSRTWTRCSTALQRLVATSRLGCGTCVPRHIPPFEHHFYYVVSRPMRVFPYKITHALANSVWKLMKLCGMTGSRMSPRS